MFGASVSKRQKKLNLASKIWSEIQRPEDETEPITLEDISRHAGKGEKGALDFSAINRAYRIADMNFRVEIWKKRKSGL